MTNHQPEQSRCSLGSSLHCPLVASRWWALPPSGDCWERWSLCSALASRHRGAETDNNMRGVLGIRSTVAKIINTVLAFSFNFYFSASICQCASWCSQLFEKTNQIPLHSSNSQTWAHCRDLFMSMFNGCILMMLLTQANTINKNI